MLVWEGNCKRQIVFWLMMRNDDMATECSPPCYQKPPAKNYSEVVLLFFFFFFFFFGLGITKCHGCKGETAQKCTCHLQILISV